MRRSPASNVDAVTELTYREAICAALADELEADPTSLLMGEDVATAGGVFKTNEGLSERFGPERVRNTPICENGFLGVALGMAVTGLRPVVEIMFSDFLPTAGDAIVNELPKFRFMSGGQCAVPVTIRSICGATGRFGTQHSATGESWYMGLPGLKVATAGDAGVRLRRARVRRSAATTRCSSSSTRACTGARARSPAATRRSPRARQGGRAAARVPTSPSSRRCCWLDRSLAAAERLAEDGIEAEVIELRWLRPLRRRHDRRERRATGRLLVVEEQVHAGGLGGDGDLGADDARRRVAAASAALSLPDNLLIPYTPELEDAVIPTVERIVDEVRSAIG